LKCSSRNRNASLVPCSARVLTKLNSPGANCRGPYCGYPADTDMPQSAWGSCGKPFPGIEVRVTDPDTGEPVEAGSIGMIELRGPHTLRGMYRRSREDLFTADGFYPTGSARSDRQGRCPTVA
jgi:acyl-CoA synthetase (AMP-forming)/AMP-acid ligase II